MVVVFQIFAQHRVRQCKQQRQFWSTSHPRRQCLYRQRQLWSTSHLRQAPTAVECGVRHNSVPGQSSVARRGAASHVGLQDFSHDRDQQLVVELFLVMTVVVF